MGIYRYFSLASVGLLCMCAATAYGRVAYDRGGKDDGYQSNAIRYGEWEDCLPELRHVEKGSSNHSHAVVELMRVHPSTVRSCSQQLVMGSLPFFFQFFRVVCYADRVDNKKLDVAKLKELLPVGLNDIDDIVRTKNARVAEKRRTIFWKDAHLPIRIFSVAIPGQSEMFLLRVPTVMDGRPYWLIVLLRGDYPDNNYPLRFIRETLVLVIEEMHMDIIRLP